MSDPMRARCERQLQWAVERFAEGRMALVSAFGPGTLVLIHMLAELRARVPVIFVDTLHHFPETLALVERVRDRYDVDLRIFRPAASRQEFEAKHGARLWERDLDLYHRLTKVEPFQRAIAGLGAYITGRRRDQAATRADLAVVELATPVRINPLATATREQVWAFIRAHAVPYNALHDAGYASIGDVPLTTSVAPGEPERAGRWRGSGRLECGMHTTAGDRS